MRPRKDRLARPAAVAATLAIALGTCSAAMTAPPGAQLGTPRGDVIRGSAANDRINGGAGNDRLLGCLGDDRLLGQADDDVLDGGGGTISSWAARGTTGCSAATATTC